MEEDWTLRLKTLEDAHRHQHAIVESLEAENAPEEIIKSAKVKKLALKDEIERLKNAN